MSEKHFNRHINTKTIEKLKSEKLFTEKLTEDIKNGDIFFAIRDKNQIHFYYKGGRVFEFNGNGFKTHYKFAYGNNAKPIKEKKYYYYENELNLSFIERYDDIKLNCESRQINKCGVPTERAMLSSLYGYSFVNEQSKDICILDMEVGFPVTDIIIDSEKPNTAQIDLLVYNKTLKKLSFIEAKEENDKRFNILKKGTNTIEVLWQLKEYSKLIKTYKEDIKKAYSGYSEIMKCVFGKDIITIDEFEVDEKPTLLIFANPRGDMKGIVTKEFSKFEKANVELVSPYNTIIVNHPMKDFLSKEGIYGKMY